MKQHAKVLVAPLNWGLGHASRCIPIIQELVKQQAELVLASDGLALHLLRHEFPALPYYQLPAYKAHYRSSSMLLNMLQQLPKFAGAVQKEWKTTQQIVQRENIDIIISDNRYGCYSSNIHSVFLCHQLFIKSGTRPGDLAIRQINRRLIRRFNELWIPDFADSPNLAGTLAHGKLPVAGQYLGPLSRMKQDVIAQAADIVVVISGPEPQRSRFESLVLQQAAGINRNFLVVQGLTDRDEKRQVGNIQLVSFMTTRELNAWLAGCQLVICRAGYSSIMDLTALRKPAILVPTPGQTEQEYLAARFHRQQIFYMQKQNELNLATAIQDVESFSGWSGSQAEKKSLKMLITQLLATTLSPP